MKKILLLLLITSFYGYSQITDLVDPKSWDLSTADYNAEVVSLPFNDLAKYMDEDDKALEESLAKPYRFGAKLQANVTKESFGQITTLDNGDEIWRIVFESQGAKTINFVINNYNLAEGAELYVYNEDKSMKIGPYTSRENNATKEVTTWPIDGDKVTVELFEPKNVVDESTFIITEMVHGYRTVTQNDLLAKGLNDSGSCNIDVDCPLGDNFELQKKSVVMMIFGGSGFCTGTLVNNTSEDKKPYILTANHCFASGSEAPVGVSDNIAFRFNWISPNPSCATFTPSTNGTFLQTGNGAVIRASDGHSDMLLYETNNNIPSSWDVVFAGWSRSTTPPPFTTGIHHPSGDIMKICRDNNTAISTATPFNGFNNQIWLISNTTGGWEEGVTEPGSSGSQLLDSNGLLIGVLSGGSAACAGTNDNGGLDFYGRLDEGWSEVGNFLDPLNNNSINIGHLPNIDLSTDNPSDELVVNIYPNPVTDLLRIQSSIDNLSSTLYDISGKQVLTSTEKEISLTSLSSGVYFIKIESKDLGQAIAKKIVKK